MIWLVILIILAGFAAGYLLASQTKEELPGLKRWLPKVGGGIAVFILLGIISLFFVQSFRTTETIILLESILVVFAVISGTIVYYKLRRN